jgi:hypothetical protein
MTVVQVLDHVGGYGDRSSLVQSLSGSVAAMSTLLLTRFGIEIILAIVVAHPAQLHGPDPVREERHGCLPLLNSGSIVLVLLRIRFTIEFMMRLASSGRQNGIISMTIFLHLETDAAPQMMLYVSVIIVMLTKLKVELSMLMDSHLFMTRIVDTFMSLVAAIVSIVS